MGRCCLLQACWLKARDEWMNVHSPNFFPLSKVGHVSFNLRIPFLVAAERELHQFLQLLIKLLQLFVLSTVSESKWNLQPDWKTKGPNMQFLSSFPLTTYLHATCLAYKRMIPWVPFFSMKEPSFYVSGKLFFYAHQASYMMKTLPKYLTNKKAPKQGREKETRGKDQSPGKQTAQKRWWAARRKGNR